MKHFKQITYYGYLDDDGKIDEYGDHWGIKVVELYTDVPEKLVIQFGDEYHDQGQSKLEGFYEGLHYAGIEFSVISEAQLSEHSKDWEPK